MPRNEKTQLLLAFPSVPPHTRARPPTLRCAQSISRVSPLSSPLRLPSPSWAWWGEGGGELRKKNFSVRTTARKYLLLRCVGRGFGGWYHLSTPSAQLEGAVPTIFPQEGDVPTQPGPSLLSALGSFERATQRGAHERPQTNLTRGTEDESSFIRFRRKQPCWTGLLLLPGRGPRKTPEQSLGTAYAPRNRA